MRTRRGVLAGLFLAGLGVAVGLALLERADGGGHATAAAVEAYEAALAGPVQRGGRVVEQGMKPAVRVLGEGGASSATLQAVAWVDELEAVRVEVSRIAPPPGLEAAPKLFGRSLSLYVDAARTIGAAAIATDTPRRRLLQEAVEKARAADDEYDRVSALLQKARERAGLAPSSRFPNR